MLVSSPFLVDHGSQRITIRDITLVGNNPDAGTADAYHAGLENQMGVAIYGSSDVEIANVTIKRVYSDCVYIGSRQPGLVGAHLDARLQLHPQRAQRRGHPGGQRRDHRAGPLRPGQHGSSSTSSPTWHSEGATNVTLRDNTIGSYGLTNQYTSWVLAAEGAAGSTVSDVSVIGNTITGNPHAGYDGAPLGLNVTVRDRGSRSDFVVQDNTSSITASGPEMLFTDVDGVTVTGNRQPLSSGQLATFPGSTGVTYANNDTSP